VLRFRRFRREQFILLLRERMMFDGDHTLSSRILTAFTAHPGCAYAIISCNSTQRIGIEVRERDTCEGEGGALEGEVGVIKR
jgi:hypothetical protein